MDNTEFEAWAEQGGILMRTHFILSALRNPYALRPEIVNGARFAAADLIERHEKEYGKLMRFAESQGVNCTVTN